MMLASKPEPKRFRMPKYTNAHRRRRRGWITGKKLDELYRVDAESGCWIWRGSVHATGVPLFRGWEYPRNTLYERQFGPLRHGRKLLGRHCGKQLCVNPHHQIRTPKLNADPKKVEPATLECLDRLCERGSLILPATGFVHAEALVRLEYAYVASKTEQFSTIKPTKSGLEIAAWRARMLTGKQLC